MKRYKVSERDAGVRLDMFLAGKLPQLSRALIKRFIDDGSVTIKKQSVKPGYKLKNGEIITVDVDIDKLDMIPDIELPVIYEDKEVLVVDKPVNVISHSRSRYWNEPSVASFVRQKTGQEGERAGIVHRLDRATSGVMICAKNQAAMSWLQKQFSNRKVKKKYVAVVIGVPDPKEALVDLAIERNPKKPQTFRVAPGGKPSQTHYLVTKAGSLRSMVELSPQTGRTHQIRVHMTYLNHPIYGDNLYGAEAADRLYLHAHELEITLPSGERRLFKSKVPVSFNKAIV